MPTSHRVTMATQIKTTQIIYSSADSNAKEHRVQKIRADLDWEEQVAKSQKQNNYTETISQLIQKVEMILSESIQQNIRCPEMVITVLWFQQMVWLTPVLNIFRETLSYYNNGSQWCLAATQKRKRRCVAMVKMWSPLLAEQLFCLCMEIITRNVKR